MREPSGESINADDLDYLIEQYLTGRLNDAEAGSLLSRLEAAPATADRLMDQLRLDAMLREVAADGVANPPRSDWRETVNKAAMTTVATRLTAKRSFWRSPRTWVVSSLAACLVAALATGLLLRTPVKQIATIPTTPSTQPIEATTSAVAVLTRTVDARWRDASSSPRVGTALAPGWLRLDAGLAEVEFFNGAQVVLEGPVELQLVSAVEAYCETGKLRAEVPTQARGFRIVTPQIKVIDRGTAFGVDVSEGSAQVHVFKGLVELHEKSSAESTGQRDLTEGQAATVDMGGVIRDVPADSAAFSTATDLDRRLGESQGRWNAKWLAAGRQANNDSSLLVRFDFENASSGERVLKNAAQTPLVANAAIVGSAWSEGRWPGKGALEFRGVSDRVRVEVPGRYESITYTAWVRVHGLDRYFNSLFMSDGFGGGATHWQILTDGKIRLGVGGGKPGDTDSPVVITPERLGQWVHLAVVYNGSQRLISHYVDGRAVSRSTIEGPRLLSIGQAELGNWNPSERSDKTPIRHFSGRVDEFAAFSRPLSDREIAETYAIGAGLTETAAAAEK